MAQARRKSAKDGLFGTAGSMFDAANEPDDKIRTCDWPGCDEEGEHRAPRSRAELNTYNWYCLEHIREFNKSWNYYEGMSDDEVEKDRRHDTTWNRPSWPLGGLEKDLRFKNGQPDINDFGAFGYNEGASNAAPPRQPGLDPKIAQAFAILDMTPPVTLDQMKRRYKELVKRYHPDANGGDKAAEEKFKQISQAFEILKTHLES